ncbi:ribonucleoside-diphosphate reductase large subunit-like, partial [Trifolium medium]|nr:ribonucleoside-diphosphate reductase large subunit-like [Trifolium medium]
MLVNCLPFSGEFVVVNKHLLRDLTEMGLWNPLLKNKIISANGSVQNLSEIPDKLKGIYKYQRFKLEQVKNVDILLQNGLKTGMYYLRTRAASDAIKFTVPVDKSAIKELSSAEAADGDDDTKMAQMVCSLTNRDDCLA